MRKRLGKVFPPHTVLPLLLTAIGMLCSYQAAKIVQMIFGFHNPHDLSLSFDLQTPFLPGWGWIYIASYFFWIYLYVASARESIEIACKLAVADFTGKMICLVFFLVFPTTNVRPSVEGSGLTMLLMRIIYKLDTPTNLFPSLHCFVSWLGMRHILKVRNLKHKWIHYSLSICGTLLVFASTLFTKQHVVVDVLGGIVVAEIGILIARLSPLSSQVQKWNLKFMGSKIGMFLSSVLDPVNDTYF